MKMIPRPIANTIMKPQIRFRVTRTSGHLIGLLFCGVTLASCSSPVTSFDSARSEFASRIANDHGEYTPQVGRSDYPSYLYYFDSRTERATLQVSYWDENLGKGKAESIQLSFIPTTIGGPRNNPNRLFLGGIEENGTTALFEFGFDFRDGFRVELEAQAFGNVSELSTISSLTILEVEGKETAYVLDGVTGEFGRLKKGEDYMSLTDANQGELLLGYTNIIPYSSSPPARSFLLAKNEGATSYYIEQQAGILLLEVNDNTLRSELGFATEIESSKELGFYF